VDDSATEPPVRHLHPDAEPLHRVGVAALLDARLRHDQQRLAEVNRLAHELIAGRADDGTAAGQVVDERLRARRAELQRSGRADALRAVDPHRPARPAQGLLDPRRELVRPVVEVRQQVLARRRPRAQHLVAQQRPDHPDARPARRRVIEARHDHPVGLAHQRQVRPAVAGVRRPVTPAQRRPAVRQDAEVIESDPWNPQPQPRPLRPRLGVGDDHIRPKLADRAHHHGQRRPVPHEVEHGREVLHQRPPQRTLPAAAIHITKGGDAHDRVEGCQRRIGFAAGQDQHVVPPHQFGQDGRGSRGVSAPIAHHAVGNSHRSPSASCGHRCGPWP